MTNREKMLSGELYIIDKDLAQSMRDAKRQLRAINATTEEEIEKRMDLFAKLFRKLGKEAWIETPFRCDYGTQITIGDNFYANYDCIILDICDVTIGDNVFFAPRVSIFTATHPIDAAIRNEKLEYGKPVRIGNDVWIGGNTVINPGVTIGDGCVIGSGSVVTRSIPPHVIAAGNPCRVIRPITEEDRIYWEAQANAYRKACNSFAKQ